MLFVGLSGATHILRMLVSPFGLQINDRIHSEECFLSVHLRAESETADTVRVTNDALADGHITPKEAEAMLKEEYEAMEARQQKISMLEEIALSGKSAKAV